LTARCARFAGYWRGNSKGAETRPLEPALWPQFSKPPLGFIQVLQKMA
jgi:hypothetical protein